MIRLLLGRHVLLGGNAARAEMALRHLRATLPPDLHAAVFSLVDMEHAWALLDLDLRDEALPLARQATVAYLPEGDLDYLPELLECLAVLSKPEQGGPWLDELLQIRLAAGLPRSRLQARRCGEATDGRPVPEAAALQSGEWRERLKALAAAMNSES